MDITTDIMTIAFIIIIIIFLIFGAIALINEIVTLFRNAKNNKNVQEIEFNKNNDVNNQNIVIGTNVDGALSITFAVMSMMLLPVFFVGLPLGIAACVFGIKGMKNRNPYVGTSIFGFFFSFISIGYNMIFGIIIIFMFGTGYIIIEFMNQMFKSIASFNS